MKKILLLILLFSSLSVHSEWQKPKLSHSLSPVKNIRLGHDFELLNMDEEKIKFSDYRGKVVLLNFWATWCPPCRREMPSMQRVQQKIGTKGFSVLALNQMEGIDEVFSFTGQLDTELSFEILFDSNSKVSQDYAILGLPTTYLIDKKGNIRYRAVGGREFDHPDVMRLIKRLMNEE